MSKVIYRLQAEIIHVVLPRREIEQNKAILMMQTY
jgi:hypothetical protein